MKPTFSPTQPVPTMPGAYLLGSVGDPKKHPLNSRSLVALEKSLIEYCRTQGYDVQIFYAPTSSTPARRATTSPTSSTRKRKKA